MSENLQKSIQSGVIPRPERLAEAVYGRILGIIAGNKLAVGDKLPSETTLAQTFAVSRPILREALMRLRLDGIVEARQGSGTYLLSRPPPSRLMAHMQPGHISAGLAAYEVRLAVETATARAAAANRSARDLQLVERQLGRFEKRLKSGRNAFKEDLALHRAIAEATGNPLFVSTLDHITAGLQEVMTAILSMTQEDSDKRKQIIVAEHREIVRAIADQDARLAGKAMDRHLRAARRRAIDGFEPGT